jgi:O-methyltransferase
MVEKISFDAVIEPAFGEPWVKLANGKDLANWGKKEEIQYNQNNRQMQKLRFYQRTFDFLTENRVNGDYYEFGCHRCRTFRMALTEARRHNLSDMKFVAFDSFEGLPPSTSTSGTSVDIWKPGVLSTSVEEFMHLIEEHAIYVDNVEIIKGFYSDSLTDALRKEFGKRPNKMAFVNIDCDLYESAVPVFDFIEPLLQEGAVIYIDDMFAGFKGNPHKGVARAFHEYRRRSSWKFIRHLDAGWGGRTFIAFQGEAVEDL